MQEYDGAGYEDLPKNQKAFINALRSKPQKSLDDAYHEKFSAFTKTIETPEDTIIFYRHLSEYILEGSKLRHHIVFHALNMGYKFSKNQTTLHSAVKAYLLSGELSTPGTREHIQTTDNMKKLLDGKKLEPGDKILALDFMMKNSQNKKQVDKYTKQWISLIDGFKDPDVKNEIVQASLEINDSYPDKAVEFLDKSLKEWIKYDPDHLDLPLTISHMMKHSKSRSDMEAYWTRIYHSYMVKNAASEQKDIQYDECADMIYDVNDEFSYTEELRELYSNLDMLVPVWSERQQRDLDDKIRIDNKVNEILNKDESSRMIELFKLSQDAYKTTDLSIIIFSTDVIDRVISNWPIPIIQNTEDDNKAENSPQANFEKFIDQRLHLIGKFTDEDGESPFISAVMDNKKKIYQTLKKNMLMDCSRENKEIKDSSEKLSEESKKKLKFSTQNHLGMYN